MSRCNQNPETSQQPSTDAEPSAPPKAVRAGKLFPEFGAGVDCYVLEDGRRVISQAGVVRALRNTAKSARAEDGDLGRYLARMPSRFDYLATAPTIGFEMPQGGVAIGREGHFFVDLCHAYVDAFMANELHKKQEKVAKTAHAFLKAVAKVGIDTLIDEACGVSRTPAERAMSRLFERLFRDEVGTWDMRWTPSIVHALAPLYGIRYPVGARGSYPKELQMPFHKIYNLIFGVEAAAEMRRRNPNPEAYTHTQILEDRAKVVLSDELVIVEAFARQSRTKDEFWARMEAHYRGAPLQTCWVN
jgi:hypothetical protein